MWLLAPYETYKILYSKARYIPWSFLNIPKLVHQYYSNINNSQILVFPIYLGVQFNAYCSLGLQSWILNLSK